MTRQLQPAEIIAEIGTLHRDVSAKVRRIHQLADSLYQSVRRAPADDNTRVYMRYASSWARFAGMAAQGAKRAAAVDKMVRGLASEAEPQESTGRRVTHQAPSVTPVDALLDMYSGGD